MCLLWLWALWQFVRLELSGSCLVVDFFSWRREILTVKDKETKRETECKGGRAVRLWQPLIPPTRSAHTLITNTPFPFLSLLLHCNLRTHTCFYWLHHASWPLLVKEKNFSPCCHTVVLPWVHTSLQKTGWLSDCCSIFLSVLSTRLHAWLLLRLSVCRSARSYHSMCVITVCQLALQCSHVCQPVCLSSSLSLCQAYIHKLPWLSELHSAILLKDDQRELFYEDMRTVVCRWARMQVTAQTEAWHKDTV